MEARRRDPPPVVAGAGRLGGSLPGAVLPVRPAPLAMGAAAGPVGAWTDPRRDRQLGRTQVRLPELRQWRSVAQHAAARRAHDGRTLPEQPPQVRDEPRLRRALVRDRPYMAGDEDPRQGPRAR